MELVSKLYCVCVRLCVCVHPHPSACVKWKEALEESNVRESR